MTLITDVNASLCLKCALCAACAEYVAGVRLPSVQEECGETGEDVYHWVGRTIARVGRHKTPADSAKYA